MEISNGRFWWVDATHRAGCSVRALEGRLTGDHRTFRQFQICRIRRQIDPKSIYYETDWRWGIFLTCSQWFKCYWCFPANDTIPEVRRGKRWALRRRVRFLVAGLVIALVVIIYLHPIILWRTIGYFMHDEGKNNWSVYNLTSNDKFVSVPLSSRGDPTIQYIFGSDGSPLFQIKGKAGFRVFGAKLSRLH